jgi:hypothetical protein
MNVEIADIEPIYYLHGCFSVPKQIIAGFAV